MSRMGQSVAMLFAIALGCKLIINIYQIENFIKNQQKQNQQMHKRKQSVKQYKNLNEQIGGNRMNRCQYCGAYLKLTNELTTCIECMAKMNSEPITYTISNFNNEDLEAYQQRKDKVLSKMKKQGDAYYSYTIMKEIYIYYDIEDCKFDIYNGSTKRFISLNTVKSILTDMGEKL